jgi:nucleotide-binding universal stress UspA family protein
VPVSGEEQSWYALTQALEIARREGGQLHGLHVVPSADQTESEKAQDARVEFIRRTEEAGIPKNM